MATIKIGDRELLVRRPTIGFWDRCLKYEVASKDKTVGQFVNDAAAIIFEAVKDNEGASEEWVREHLSFPPTEEWKRLMIACGFALEQEAETPAGEAKIQ